MKSGKLVLGVMAGLAAGAVLGVLLAPDKGSVTRKKVMEKGEDLADNLKQKFNDLVDDIVQKNSSEAESEGKSKSADNAENARFV